MRDDQAHDEQPTNYPDYRFSLANERTFLAWIRTALALVAGGIAGAKALDFDHAVWRWFVSAPPIVAGAVLAVEARRRWRLYETDIAAGRPLPVGRWFGPIGIGIAIYAVIALLAAVLDT
jgi:putative membrane protein